MGLGILNSGYSEWVDSTVWADVFEAKKREVLRNKKKPGERGKNLLIADRRQVAIKENPNKTVSSVQS